MIKTVCDRCGKEIKGDKIYYSKKYVLLKIDLCVNCYSEYENFMDGFLNDALCMCYRCRNNGKRQVCKDCIAMGGKYNNFICK